MFSLNYGIIMINIFVKGKKTIIIASPNSADWNLKRGDEYYPEVIYKTSDAFTKKWKELERSGYKLVKFISSKPAGKSKKKYFVKSTPAKDVPPLLKEFAGWLKGQVYGSVGWFELITKKLPKELVADKKLIANSVSFINLPDGSEIALTQNSTVTFFDSEGGKPKQIANSLKEFLAKLSLGKTGVSDLDEIEASGRIALQEFIKKK